MKIIHPTKNEIQNQIQIAIPTDFYIRKWDRISAFIRVSLYNLFYITNNENPKIQLQKNAIHIHLTEYSRR